MHPITLLGVLLIAGLQELHGQRPGNRRPLVPPIQQSGCSINVNRDLPDPQPLLLIPGGSNDGRGFLLPTDSSGIVKVQKGGNIRIACPGRSNYVNHFPVDTQEATVTCVGGADFTTNDGRQSLSLYKFREFYCSKSPQHTARASPSGERCKNGIINEIGFTVGRVFIKTIDICFDVANKNSLWSKYLLVAGIGGSQTKTPSPAKFIDGPFYPNIDVLTNYSRLVQQNTVKNILDPTAQGTKYINMSESSNYFLARGHLSAKADFVYGSQQSATFYFINVAPQWQTFNSGNWNTMENAVREFASNKTLDLIVYTGTNGVITLPDREGVEREIWLYEDANENKAIPVPKVFWKVLYDPKSKKAIAFLGVNNPYIQKPDKSYLICRDICVNREVSWLRWPKNDVGKGISYCCAVDKTFRAAVGTLPEFEVSGLLL